MSSSIPSLSPSVSAAAPQPSLPSFPTRRSSYLAASERSAGKRYGEAIREGGASRWFAVTLAGRSEEHTSELQSHSDLVCRLLLEKKKGLHHRGRARQSLSHWQPLLPNRRGSQHC